MTAADPDGFDFDRAWSDLYGPLTREQRIKFHYLAMAGPYPGPNRAAIAAILAHRWVELEDAQGGAR